MTSQDNMASRNFEGKGMTVEFTEAAGNAQLLTMATPDGPFTIIARDGVVLASGWTADVGELTGQIHPALLPAAYESVENLGAISAAVEAFYAGDPAPAMSVPVLQRSGPFRAHAWDVLLISLVAGLLFGNLVMPPRRSLS